MCHGTIALHTVGYHHNFNCTPTISNSAISGLHVNYLLFITINKLRDDRVDKGARQDAKEDYVPQCREEGVVI